MARPSSSPGSEAMPGVHLVRYPERAALVALNVVGGLGVLASYALVLSYGPDVREGLWGGLPPSGRSLYTASMLLAAAGYFPFTIRLVLATTPDSFRRITGHSYAWLFAFYALVLIPSACWLPMTAEMIRAPDPTLWVGIRGVLGGVGAGALGLLWSAWRMARAEGGRFSWLAVAAAAAFVLQTAVLDALVWPVYFAHGFLPLG